MSKVLKIAAAVVGAAAIIIATGGAAAFGIAGALSTTVAGISAGALLTVSSALSIGASLLAKKPKAPTVNAANIDRLNSTIDLRTPRKIVWGDTAGANDVRDQEYTDNQTVLHRFIVVASHKVHSIYEIWFDDEKAWDSVSGVAAKFAGYLTVTPVTEGNAFNAINISPRMGSSRRYTGLAYVYLRFKLTGNTKKTESPFVQSIPTRVTIRTKGAYVYDPRLDSTRGGSGPHRADDQSTWEWSESASRNPALQMLWWMLGWRINGKIAVGGGIPPERIDMESFITAANLCDEDVSIAAGGTEPRYRSDGVVSEGDSPTVIMDALKAAMNADLDDVGGKLRLFVFHNDLGTPLADFTSDDILGAFEYRATAALDESFNVVRGTYTDPRDQALYQQIDYPQVELPSRDGIDRIDTFPLALVQSPSQAQRLAKQRLQRMQFGGVFTATGQATWWKVQKNSVVRLTFPPRGWVNKLFRVAELEHRVDGTVPITLREEAAQIYAWDEEEGAPVQANNGLGYNRAENPIVIAIDDSGAVIPTPGSPIVSTVRNEFGEPRDPAQLLNSSLSATQGGRIGYEGQEGRVEVMRLTPRLLETAPASAITQVDSDIDSLRRAITLALRETTGVRKTLRDAGVYVDPENGQVKISAIDQTAERLNQVGIILDAQAATINLKASTNYVDEQIILAVLNPEQAAELGPLITRLTQAETDIDGLNATIITKASVVDLNTLGGRVTTAETDIDALQGEITLKVSNTTFDALADRVTTAETQLEAIPDAASITNSVNATRLVQRQADDLTDANILGLILGDRAKRDQVAAIAAARNELGARITEEGEAQARFAVALQARVGAAESSIATESLTRANQFMSLAQSLTSLQASFDTEVGTLQGNIDALAQVVTDETGALSTTISEVSAALTQEIEDREEAVDTVDARVTSVEEASVERDGEIRGLITRQSTAIRGSQEEAARFQDGVISGLLLGDRAARQANQQIAFAREEIVTQLTDLESGFSSSLFALGLRIGAAEGSIRELDRIVIENNTTLVQSIDTLRLDTEVLVGGTNTRVDTVESDLGNTIGRVDTLEEDLPAGLAAEEAARNVAISGAITAERVLWQEGDSIIAGDLATLTTTVGENTATLVTYGESIDGLEARGGIRFDINGRVSGVGVTATADTTKMTPVVDAFELVDPDTGFAYLTADEDGLRLQNGKIVMDNGTYMQVTGTGFGTASQFIQWFGPTRAINLCDEASALSYLKTNGDAYFGGSLSAGVIRNSARTTDITNAATITIGPFGTNGEPILVVTSYGLISGQTIAYPATTAGLDDWEEAVTLWGATATGTNPNRAVNATKAISCSIIVETDGPLGASSSPFSTLTISGGTETLVGTAPIVGDSDGVLVYTRTISGSVTATDNSGGTANRTFIATLTTRTDAVLGTIQSQTISLTATEE